MPTPTSPDIPLSYTVPAFPSLYWPINNPSGVAYYLYYQFDILRFTLYWTFIAFAAVHVATSLWAVLMHVHHVGRVESRWLKFGTLSRGPMETGLGGQGHHGRSGIGAGVRASSNSEVGEEIEMQESERNGQEQARVPTATGANTSRRKQAKKLRWVWLIPVVYCVIGGIEALMAGSFVGLVLGSVYEAGYFKMSTWMPFIWALIMTLILILSSFSIQGGL